MCLSQPVLLRVALSPGQWQERHRRVTSESARRVAREACCIVCAACLDDKGFFHNDGYFNSLTGFPLQNATTPAHRVFCEAKCIEMIRATYMESNRCQKLIIIHASNDVYSVENSSSKYLIRIPSFMSLDHPSCFKE